MKKDPAICENGFEISLPITLHNVGGNVEETNESSEGR
jgi:hypothetical protein